ncbi:MAG: PKD-like domain-containing protein, partial [Bacteroidota bacterium]
MNTKSLLPSKRNLVILVTMMVALLLSAAVEAQIIAISGGNWEDAGNWSNSAVPLLTDDVIIGEDVEMIINSPGAVCASLQVGGTTYGYGGITIADDATLEVGGNVILGGTDNGSWGWIILGSGSTFSIGGNIQLGSNSVVTNSDGAIDFGDGSIVSVSGSMTLGGYGTNKGYLDFELGGLLQLNTSIALVNTAVTIGTGTIEYNGVTQTVAPWTYNNLTLSGSGVKSTSGVTVTGIITMAGTASVNPSYYITGGGSATLLYEGSGLKTTGGEFGQLSASKRAFGGTGGVVINNPGGVSLGSNSEISGTLTLTSGSFAIGANTLILTGPAIAGTASNTVTTSSSSLTYISNSPGLFIPSSVANLNALSVTSTSGLAMQGNVSCVDCEVAGKITTGSFTLNVINSITGSYNNTKYISGKLSHPFAKSAGISSFSFPIGDATKYTPVEIIFNSIATAGNLTVFTTQGLHPDYTHAGLKEPTVVNRYWTVTNSGMVFSTYSIKTFFVSSATPTGDIRGGSTSNYVIRRYNGATWPLPVNTIAHNSDNTQASGLTAFSDFIIGEGSANAARSTLTPLSSSIAADNITTQTLVVTAYDAVGNLIGGGGSAVTIALQSGIGTIGAVEDKHDGTYIALVQSPTGGSGTFVATLDLGLVQSGTATQTQAVVTYTTPQPDLGKSSLSPTASTIIADGTCSQTLTVKLYDILNVPVIDYAGTVTFSRTSGSGTFVAAGVLTAGTNEWTSTVKWNVTGTSGNFRARLSSPAGYVQGGTGATQIAIVSYLLSNAGPDQSKCNNGSFTLAGNNPSPGTGAWTLISGTATPTSPTLYNSGVTGVPPGTSATLRWTITENGCTHSDDVILTNVPGAAAGADQVQCNTSTFTLAANNPSPGTGAWSIVSGTGTVTTASSPTSEITGVTAGSTTELTWTVTNGVICNTTDNVLLTNNPLGQANQPSNQVVCNTASTTQVNFTSSYSGSGVTSYAWTNNQTSIGLAASGTGNINALTATNSGSAPVIATITVTPIYTYLGLSCSGPSKDFTITVKPKALGLSTPSLQTICSDGTVSITLSTSNNLSGTTYAWSRDNMVAVTGATSGTGDISSSLNNVTGLTQTVTYTITPTTDGCVGNDFTATAIVKPEPVGVPNPSLQTICSDGTVSITLSTSNNLSGTTYAWSRDNMVAVTGATSGTGDISSSLNNITGSTQTVTYTITPTTD